MRRCLWPAVMILVGPGCLGLRPVGPATGAAACPAPYPLAQPFKIDASIALPFGDADTTYALIAINAGGSAAGASLVLEDAVEPSPFPGELAGAPAFGAPPAGGHGLGGGFAPTVSTTIGSVAPVDVFVPGGFASIRVETVHATARLVIVEDVTTPNPSGRVPLAQVQELASRLESYVMVRNELAIGPPSDVDRNGRIVVVMSPTVGSVGAGAYVNAYDLVVPANRPGLPSNGGEYVYIQPENLSSASMFDARFAHELGHLLHFAQKFVRNDRDASSIVAESSTTTEGVAHLVQDLAGLGDDQAIILSNLLAQPRALTRRDLFEGAPATGPMELVLAQRGAIYTFLRYLFDRAGGADYSRLGVVADGGGLAFLRGYAGTRTFGTQAIEDATGVAIEALWRDYLIAMAASGRRDRDGAVLALAPRFRFAPRQADANTRQHHGFDPRGTIQLGATPTHLTGPSLGHAGAVIELAPTQAAFFDVSGATSCQVRRARLATGASGVELYAVRVR